MIKKINTDQENINSAKDLIQASEKSMQKKNLISDKPFEWLNENSRKFLAAGYLGEGLSLSLIHI